jgi:tRNA threonylcarbamoyladenosine biosynthesis protein TsaE
MRLPFTIQSVAHQSFDLQSEAQTQALGAALAARLGPGDIVYLKGEMGAGKSALARAIIRNLNPKIAEVPSPTFGLMALYEGGAFAVAHLDLYRLKAPEEVFELGLDEIVDGHLVLIEWPENLGYFGFDRRLEIILKETGAQARHVDIFCYGGFRFGDGSKTGAD